MLKTRDLVSPLQYAIQLLVRALRPSSDTGRDEEEVISQISFRKLPDCDVRMELTLQEVLVRALRKLGDSSFQRFIEKLGAWKVRDGYRNIPKDDLTGKDPEHVAGLINKYYRYAYGAEVTLDVLEDIEEKKVLSEFHYDLSKVDISGHRLGTTMFTDMVNFIEDHQPDIIVWITDVEPVLRDLQDQDLLTQEQYSDVMRKEISQDRMEDLCDMIRHWEDTGKYMAYKVLNKYNEDIIKDLEAEDKRRRNNWPYGGEHWMRRNPRVKDKTRVFYIHRHKVGLIIRMKNVRQVIDDLFHENLLKGEQREYLKRVPDSEDAIKRLFSIMRHWGDRDMEKVYRIMNKYNGLLIDDLKMLESSNLREPAAEFLEKHHLDLISMVIMVDPILDDLREQGLLGHKQYDLLRREPSIRKKMTELLDIVSNWEDKSKKKFFKSVCAHNPSVIRDLQGTERNKPTEPDPHSKEAWFASQNKVPTRIQPFYTVDSDIRVTSLKTESARAAVQFSYRSNPIRNNHGHYRNPDPKSVRDRKHFVDEHCWDLIRRIILVDPVIDDLLEHNLVTQEQYNALTRLKTPQRKMIDLYDIVRSWPNLKKDQVYLALRQHNPAFVRVLEKSDQKLKSNNANKGSHYQRLTLDLETGSSAGEHFLDKNKSGLINVMSTVDPVVEDLRGEGLLTEEQYHNILLKETSREKMEEIYNITDSFDNVKKDKVYLALRTHNRSHIRVMEQICKPSISVSDHSGEVVAPRDILSDEEEEEEIDWETAGSALFPIICSVCTEIYKTPVTLICGHNFCLECIEKTWNNKDKDNMSCPFCKRRFRKRPELNKNPVLCQIAELCQLTSVKKTHERCTYCTSPFLQRAVKQCLLCEAFLCEEHLKVHSKQAEHVMLDPSVSLKNRKCSIHKVVLEYYCSQDSACVCAHCCIVGKHKGHQVIPIREAMEIKKDKLGDTEENPKTQNSEKSVEEIMEDEDIPFEEEEEEDVDYGSGLQEEHKNPRYVLLAGASYKAKNTGVEEIMEDEDIPFEEEQEEDVDYGSGLQEEDKYPRLASGSIEFAIICCICMERYKNPVTLICGHNYCLGCIEKIWNNQDSDDTCCPICRRRFKDRPELNKNLVLCQIAESRQSTSNKKTHKYCTYCSYYQYPAVKQCLLCEAFLCEDHLKVHNKKAEHFLLEPSMSPKNRRCSIHHTVLEYYCSQDSTLICAHCCIGGEHKGHQVIPIREAMEIKKDKLRDNEENLNLKKSEIEKSIKICMQKVQEKINNAPEEGTDVNEVQEISEILKLVQGGLSIEERQATLSVEDLILQLEAKSSHLTQCISHIEELCYETDPFLVLQDQEDYNL